MTLLRGIRGATTSEKNSREAILEATSELLRTLVDANNIKVHDIAFVQFTTTTDLTAEFPAVAARLLMGWEHVAMMCGHEMSVPDDVEMCIRVMILANTAKAPHELKRAYLRKAKNLRSRGTKKNEP